MSNYISSPADVQNAYWSGRITRKEAQAAFDEMAQVLISVKEQQMKLDMAVSYLLEQSNVTPVQIEEFMKRKAEEFLAKQKAAE